MKSPEFYALGLFFSLNALVLQFYLGTARIQLEELSASNHRLYVQLLSFIVPGEISRRFVELSTTTPPVLCSGTTSQTRASKPCGGEYAILQDTGLLVVHRGVAAC